MLDNAFFKERSELVRNLAVKANDQFTKKRLSDLADRYEAKAAATHFEDIFSDPRSP